MEKKSSASTVYNIVKVITVLLVVVAHSTRMYTSNGAFRPLLQSNFLALTTDYIYVFHMPLFIFVSGAVYGLCIQRGKYTRKIDFLLNKAKRLLVPYFVFGFFYVAPVMCLTGLTQQGYFSYCYHGIVLSLNSRHLWFLEALFLIFGYSVLIRKWILKSHGMRIILLGVSVVFYIASRFMPAEFQIRAAFSYQLFFVMGAIFQFYYEKITDLFVKFWYLWIFLPVILLGNFFFNPNAITSNIYKLVGILMVLMFAVLLEKWTQVDKTKWFLCIKDYSMGIFLFHPMIIYLGYFWLFGENIPPLLLATGNVIVSLLLSIVLTKIVRKLRLGYLMGE